MAEESRRTELVKSLDAAIAGFNLDGRLARTRATRRARRLTGLDWTYSALMALESLKDIGGIRMSELADLAGTTPPTITKLIRHLEERGVIDRVPDQEDGRASIVALTDEGRQMAEAITGARQDALGQVVTDWDDSDLEQTVLLFDRLRAAMRRLS